MPRKPDQDPDKKRKPTIAELFQRSDIMHGDIERMGEIATRLIQIQAAQKELEAERGYTSPDGVRHPGISDELEDLLIAHRLPGLTVEDFVVYPMAGSTSRIDANLILADGYGPELIKRWTATTNWTAVGVRRTGEKPS